MDVGWEEFGWERLAEGVGRRRLPGWDATAGLVVGGTAALLFDAGATLREGAELRAQAQGLLGAGRRVTHIALSHAHFDHVLGAAAFAGAQVFGAVGMAELLRRDREALRADAVRHGVAPDEAGEAVDVLVHPHHVVSGEWTLDLGGRQVLLANAGPGHTGHDLALLVPAPGGGRPRWCSAATSWRSRTSRRPALTRCRPAGRRPWTGCCSWAARTRCTCRGTGRWWTRRSSAPNATRWRGGSACGDGSRCRTVGGMRQYDPDLTPPWKKQAPAPEVPAEPDLVVEEVATGFCGAVVRCEAGAVTLEDRFGKHRVFPLVPRGFLLEGRTVTLVRPRGAVPARPSRTASGSVAVPGARARVARAGRIYVEGRHDAELVEKVWGDDLRVEGVVVEYLEGVDDLPAVVRDFRPGPDARLGVLVDHLVPGSKESRIAASVTDPHVLVVGHPYVDVWQAVKPSALGIPAWPTVPRGQDWKTGVCRALGWPAGDTGAAWRRILAAVHSYKDLEPELLGRVEHLIDWVTSPA